MNIRLKRYLTNIFIVIFLNARPLQLYIQVSYTSWPQAKSDSTYNHKALFYSTYFKTFILRLNFLHIFKYFETFKLLYIYLRIH